MKIFKMILYSIFVMALLGISACDASSPSKKVVEQAVELSNSYATMVVGTSRIFHAKAVGLSNTDVIWSIGIPLGDESIEQIDGNNVIFNAPKIAGKVWIRAASVKTPTITGIVEITVVEQLDTEEIFNNGNISTVQSGPINPTIFTIDRERTITYVNNYHYFNKGILPGTISFKHADGTTYGPWQSVGAVGQGNVVNAYWICYPNILIKSGTYTVIDSHPATWSHNSGSKNCGFTIIQAIK